jgi:hypothetical protein
MDLRKQYRAAKNKESYRRRNPVKLKIINLIPYSSWKLNSVSYKRFNCNACHVKQEAPMFYVSCLRYCLVVRRPDILRCKKCHNAKAPIIKIDVRREMKAKAPTLEDAPINVQEWAYNERINRQSRTYSTSERIQLHTKSLLQSDKT